MARTTVATIDLNALRQNFRFIQRLNPTGKTLAVIKANAYGHGALAVSRALEQDADCLAVAFMDEARELREQGITKAIIALEGPYSKSEARWAAENNVTLVVHRLAQLDWIAALSQRPHSLWLKIDTGMHRLGLMPQELDTVFSQYAELLTGDVIIFTHLACADEENNAHTQKQLDALQQILARYHYPVSVANSAGIVQWSNAHGAWNRAGIALYGGRSSQTELNLPLEPVMTLFAPIIAMRTIQPGESVGYGATWTADRETTIATVAIGYADGYPRHARNGTPAWCKGQRILLAGRVSMDMLTFDVTDAQGLEIGDMVELWGKNQSVDEVAHCAGTIDYELITRVSDRVPRAYE
ncbi:alanine racemase [Alteromonas facilis]|uniref:alanine racemase n=1 Tax=Alteromonas facilis TaxID=2048004 RepID=UPI000C2951DD|nr:alanine racemase [Alteromonas facilis]